MAPFRASRATRSGRPGGPVDENVFLDGLPVRQWRQQETTVGAATDPYGISAPGENGGGAGINAWPQYGMPKGSETYPAYLQQALRGLRNGFLPQQSWENGKNGSTTTATHRTTRVEDENDEGGEADGHIGEGATKAASKNSVLQQGFMAKRWVQVPRDSEEPEREYLAKKRKGVTATFGTGVNGVSVPVTSAVPMRKTKVRKLDAQGNPTVFEVLVAEGQTVDGEITEDLTLENAAAAIVTPAPGTYVEGVGVANQDGIVVANDAVVAPVRRRPPPPRRKPKRGPGRGHKKIVVPEGESNAASTDGNATSEAGDANDGKLEGVDGEEQREDEEEDDDEGDEGDEGEDDDGEDHDMSEVTRPNEPKESETPEAPVHVRDAPPVHPLRQVETIEDDEPAMDIDVQSTKAESIEPLVKDSSAPQEVRVEAENFIPERPPIPEAVVPPGEETFSQPAALPVMPPTAAPEQRQETPPKQAQEQQERLEQRSQSPERPELEELTPPTPPAPAYEPLSQVSSYDAGPSSQPVDGPETATKPFAEGTTGPRPEATLSTTTETINDKIATSTNPPAVEPHGILVEQPPLPSDATAVPQPDIVQPPQEALNTADHIQASPEQALEIKEPDHVPERGDPPPKVE